MSRGKALVMLKDRVGACGPVLQQVYDNSRGSNPQLTLRDFREFLIRVEFDLYQEEINNHYLEVCGWPEDDADEAACDAVCCTLGQFAAALVRVANAYFLANEGHMEMALHEQFT